MILIERKYNLLHANFFTQYLIIICLNNLVRIYYEVNYVNLKVKINRVYKNINDALIEITKL
jgi:hypothetical protein